MHDCHRIDLNLRVFAADCSVTHNDQANTAGNYRNFRYFLN